MALAVLLIALSAALTVLGAGAYFYVRFNRLIEERLAGNIYQNTSRVFAAPKRIAVGEVVTAAELVQYLQGAGYGNSPAGGPLGRYTYAGSAVEILPGKDSWFAGKDGLRVEFAGRRIARIAPWTAGPASPPPKSNPR